MRLKEVEVRKSNVKERTKQKQKQKQKRKRRAASTPSPPRAPKTRVRRRLRMRTLSTILNPNLLRKKKMSLNHLKTEEHPTKEEIKEQK